LHYFKELYCKKKVQPVPPQPGHTVRKQKNFKEMTMLLDVNGNLIPIAAMFVPIVGSIALFSFLAVASWSEARRKEREAYYMGETLKKIAESSGEGAKSALDLLREQEKNSSSRRHEGMKLAGLITTAVGIGVMVLLYGLVPREEGPVYLSGVIPLLIGVALLLYVFMLAPKSAE
jgi:hypothetical protein